MVHNLNWYSSDKTIHEMGQIKKLRITDYEITYSQIGDNRYLPYIHLFGEINLFDTVTINVSSECLTAYTGQISKIVSKNSVESESIVETPKISNEEVLNDAADAYFRLAVMQKEKGDMDDAIGSIEKSITYLNEIHNSDLLIDALNLAVELYETADYPEHARRCRERLKGITDENSTAK